MYPILSPYRHIVNPKLKHTYLKLDEEGNLIIKSPKVSQAYIEKLLLSKAAWIANAQKKLQKKKGKLPTFSQDSRLYYLGESCPLILQPSATSRTSLRYEEAAFTLHYSAYDEKLFARHIDRFYKEEATRLIPPLVEKWMHKMALYPKEIVFRKTKRQWGSCSSKNVLSFNTMMMKLPPDVIEYIIVHELSHIRHKHHRKQFWDTVETHLPHYRTLVRELKTYI